MEVKNLNLKLRAWDKNHKLMDYIEDLYWFEENGVHNFDGNGIHMDYDIMLCSGLHDSKRTDKFPYGQEVYENDIIKDLEGNIYKVIFFNGMFLADCKVEDIGRKHLVSVLSDGAYVIGNTYEKQ